MTNTNSHSTPSHHKSHPNNTDRHKHKYHKRIQNTIVITIETNPTMEIHTIDHITVDTTIGQGSMK